MKIMKITLVSKMKSKFYPTVSIKELSNFSELLRFHKTIKFD